MSPPTLRSMLPLPVVEIAVVAAMVAEIVARLHDHGAVHGSVGIDDVLVRRAPGGTLEVGLTAPAGRGAPGDDVAALGSMITAALALSRRHDPGAEPAVRELADIAAVARRATLDGAISAGDVRDALASWLGDGRSAVVGDPPGRRRTALTGRFLLGAWVALLVATVWWLPSVAPRVSPPPLLGGLAAVSEWFEARDAAVAVAGVLRMAVHGCAIYLLASTFVACAMELLPSRAAHRLPLLERLTATPVRRIVHAAFGVGLTVGALASLTARTTAPTAAKPPATAPPVASTSTTTAPPALVTPLEEDEPPAAVSPDRTWTVRPGDHFWNIAERVVGEGLGRPASDAEVAPYWRLLVETNRDRLADPANEDLLFDGQQLGVPPLPVPPDTSAP